MGLAAVAALLVGLSGGSLRAQPSERPAVVPGEGVLVQEGLVLAGWDYFETAWKVDPIEFQLIEGTWRPPSEGDRIDEGHVWRSSRADSAGWISDRNLRGGYFSATFESPSDGVLILEGMGYRTVLVNSRPYPGNLYGFKDDWQSWEPPFDFSFVPVRVRSGKNDLLFLGGRSSRIRARLHDPETAMILNLRDITVPDLIVGEVVDAWASVAVINAGDRTVGGLSVEARVEGGPVVSTPVPDMPGASVRKVAFRFERRPSQEVGQLGVDLAVRAADETILTTGHIVLSVKERSSNQRHTFISGIDGSVQYYGLNPAHLEKGSPRPALVLSVHGAAVEAINQTGSYRAKTWANIVAPTNRRPYGFNWEDWGRLDALEVLDIAEQTLEIDPDRIYLTGHSMGGHGSWHLGALYPDRFAAIGPSAGWISFWSYRPRGAVAAESPVREMLMRATLPSHTMDLAPNYADLGVYIIHGADDDNVPAEQSRMMVERLKSFHRDFVYHEEPDAGHWWDKNDEDGADCVDWPPLFDFFARHARPEAKRVRDVDFITPSPGVSSCHRWACILTQIHPYRMSRISLRFDPGKARFVGETENVERLVLTVPEIVGAEEVTVHIDDTMLSVRPMSGRVYLRSEDGRWISEMPPSAAEKGPHRYGTFKDAFRHRVLLVYGTEGSDEENEWALAKARFDSGHFWYQGNSGMDIIPDTAFDAGRYADRNVVLYGNARTNEAWEALMGESPVQVDRGRVAVGERVMTGDDLGVLVIRPRQDSDQASVAAVTGTGIRGMRATNLRPYLSAGFAYPDVTIFRANARADLAVGAGFFGNDWSVKTGEFVWSSEHE